ARSIVLKEARDLLKQRGKSVTWNTGRMRLTHVRKSSNKKALLGDGEFPNVFHKRGKGSIGEQVLLYIGSVEGTDRIAVLLQVIGNRGQRFGSRKVPNHRNDPVAALEIEDESIVFIRDEEVPRPAVQIRLQDQFLQARKSSHTRPTPVAGPGAK